jgi:hypothetical protein
MGDTRNVGQMGGTVRSGETKTRGHILFPPRISFPHCTLTCLTRAISGLAHMLPGLLPQTKSRRRSTRSFN